MEVELEPNEINNAIYNYLLKNGFSHAAFALQAEIRGIKEQMNQNTADLEEIYILGKTHKRLLESDQIDEDSVFDYKEYIDKSIRERIPMEERKDRWEIPGEKLANGHSFGDLPQPVREIKHFSFYCYDQFIYGLDDAKEMLFILDVEEGKVVSSCNLKESIKEKVKKVLFRSFIYLYSDTDVYVFDKQNYSLIRAYKVDKLKTVYEIDQSLVILRTESNAIVMKDHQIVFNLDKEIRNVHVSLNCVFFSYKDKTGLYALNKESLYGKELLLNGNEFISFGKSEDLPFVCVLVKQTQESKDNAILILNDQSFEFVCQIDVDSKFTKVIVNGFDSAVLYSDNAIKRINLNTLEYSYSYTSQERITNVIFIDEKVLLVEFVGNRFKKLNTVMNTEDRVVKINSEMFMIYNGKQKKLVEIVNPEAFNIIGI